MTSAPPSAPPWALLIYRDALIDGREADYETIEEDAARICVELNCPNAHLAMLSLDGPNEVWWLTPFASEADKQRIMDGYATNTALTTALAGISKRREGVVVPGTDVVMTYRADLSGGAPWRLAGARFVVAITGAVDRLRDGAVFEAPDGTHVALRPVATEQEAEAIAAAWSAGARVFAIRPYWGMPAREWIAADPEFWRVSPMASRVDQVGRNL